MKDARTVASGAQLPLRVGISRRALFDLEAAHEVYEAQGVEAYLRSQRESQGVPLKKGPGFAAVERLLALNEPNSADLAEVILISRNAPDASLRTFATIRDFGLDIATGSFTGGGPVAPLLRAWDIDLFLSNNAADVAAAAATGVAAAAFGAWPRHGGDTQGGDLRIAFDGDCVLFGSASDDIYEREGLEAFLLHENEHAALPMSRGPFSSVLAKLAAIRRRRLACGQRSGVRTALVTARSAPAHARAVNTLAAWGTQVDEAHFVGQSEKGAILAAFGAHAFFDDRAHHILCASRHVVSALVPAGEGDGRESPRGQAANAEIHGMRGCRKHAVATHGLNARRKRL